MTFEEWYAQNREKILELRRYLYLPSEERAQKAVAEIVWNLTRPGVTYTIDKTTELVQIDLAGGLQKGEIGAIIGIPEEESDLEIGFDLDYCPKCGSFDVLWGKRYTNPNQIELKCETCKLKWTKNEQF